MSKLRDTLSRTWFNIQGSLFPWLSEELGPLTGKQQELVTTLEWTGYKLHIDVADGGIPICAVLTSASTHDSQVAIPLTKMSSERVTNLYDVMDSAYDVPQIHDMSRQLGHIPLIDAHPHRDKALSDELTAEKKRCQLVGHKTAEAVRYNERSTVERVNARLKDEFGGRVVRVRGHAKVMCHLMFGILALTATR